MTDWPLTIDGDEYHPIPDSWIEHGHDAAHGSPRVYATSVAHRGRQRIAIRYLHPSQPHVIVATMEATPADDGDGLVPALLARRHARWPRSTVPAAGQEPADVARYAERQHMRSLWDDRLDTDAERVLADGGHARALGAVTDLRQTHLDTAPGCGGMSP